MQASLSKTNSDVSGATNITNMQIIARMTTIHQKEYTRSQIIFTLQSTALRLDIKTKLLSLPIIYYVATNPMGVNTNYTTS